jgi:hypothetical protein
MDAVAEMEHPSPGEGWSLEHMVVETSKREWGGGPDLGKPGLWALVVIFGLALWALVAAAVVLAVGFARLAHLYRGAT